MNSKKDIETRGPFFINTPDIMEAAVYITSGVIDFSLSSKLLQLCEWPDIEDAISAKMKTLGTEMTELAKQRNQLGDALRSGDPRKSIEETKDEDTSGTSK
jgi:hypothetical protein